MVTPTPPVPPANPAAPSRSGRWQRPVASRRLRFGTAVGAAAAVLGVIVAAVVVVDHPPHRVSSGWTAPDSSPTAAGTAPGAASGLTTAPSTASSATPKPSASAARRAGGAAGTGPAGWPGPGNTGVPAGVRLRPSGTVTVSTDGTVLDGLDVSGCINVEASHVTIRRTRVRGTCDTGSISTPETTDPGNVMIVDVEVDGLDQTTNNPGIAYSGFTCLRCNVHDVGTGIRMGKAVRVEDSYLHGSHGGPDSHNAAMAGHGTNHLVLRHSWLECMPPANCSSSLSLYSDDGETNTVLVQGNHFSGGSYCVYGGAPDPGAGFDIRYLDNVFATAPFAKCGDYGPVTQFTGGRGNVWTGNHWDDAAKSLVTAA